LRTKGERRRNKKAEELLFGRVADVDHLYGGGVHLHDEYTMCGGKTEGRTP
jgi:hypothetical protein